MQQSQYRVVKPGCPLVTGGRVGPVRAVVAVLLLLAPPTPVTGLVLPLFDPPAPVLGLVLPPPLQRPQLLSQTWPSGIQDSLQVPHSTHCEHGTSGLSGFRASVHSGAFVVELDASTAPPEDVLAPRDDVEDELLPPFASVVEDEPRLEDVVPPDCLIDRVVEELDSLEVPPKLSSSSVVAREFGTPPLDADIFVPPTPEPPRPFAEERDCELVEP
ncbi:MAG TPA: hypothetical protein VKP30_09525 [Polyangiaceae bacterium]|nr:hypothetical protein [Polyangiaceae bacterium]